MRAFILAILLSIGSHTHAGDLPEWATSQADDKLFRSTVTDAALARAPTWAQQMDRPPLSARRAYQLAYTQLQQITRDAKQWDLREIGLVDTGDQLHWIYVVRFTRHYPKDVEVIGGAQYFNIVVLMDGTAIKPEVLQDHGSNKSLQPTAGRSDA